MAWSGGNFTRANPTWASDAANGIGIEASRHDTQDNDFTTGIDQCLNKTGQNAMTGALSMGSNKITNLAAGTLRNDAAQVGQIQDGTSSYLGTTGGTSTAFTVTATPTITALVTGAQYSFKANAANGVAATLKIDGTTATTMQRQGTALVGNEFKANDFVSVVYDGTNFQITNIATAPLYVNRTNNTVGIGGSSRTAQIKLDVKGIIACGSGIGDSEVVWTRPTVADATAWNISVRTDVGGSNEDLKVLRFLSAAFVDIPVQIQSTTGFVGLGLVPSYRLHLSTDSAAKPTTNTWTISSDARIKTNVQPYSKGLTEICQVEPITYDYNGKGGIAAGPGGVSILAQDLQPIFPECVSSYKGKLDQNDTNETDILNYNGHAITFALINAVKELNAKVEALEARIAALEA